MHCIIILLNVLIGEKPGDKENATTAVNHIWIATLHSGLYWTAIVHRNLSSKQSSLWLSHRASRPTTWDLNNAQLSLVAKALDLLLLVLFTDLRGEDGEGVDKEGAGEDEEKGTEGGDGDRPGGNGEVSG